MKIDKFGQMVITGDGDTVTIDISGCDFNCEDAHYATQDALAKDAILELLLHTAKCAGVPLVETILMRYATSPSARTH